MLYIDRQPPLRICNVEITTAESWSPGCTRDRGSSTWKVKPWIKNTRLLIPFAIGFQGYLKEVEAIFDEDDDCCYDPNNDSVILGASGIFNSVKYFNSSTYIYVK